MKPEDAKFLAVLVNRQKRYRQILELLKSGYADEWIIKNTHTGAEVELSGDDWIEIRAMVRREYNEATQKIEGY